MSNPIPESVNETFLRGLKIRSGKGTGKEGDRCSIQEYRAWIGLDPRFDTIPKEDSAVVGSFIIGFQDRIISAGATPEQVFEFVTRHLPSLRFSGRSKKLEARRSYLLNDVLLREVMPLWLEVHVDLAPYAERLRALGEITDAKTYEAAIALRDEARAAAWNKRQSFLEELKTKLRASLPLLAKPEGLSDRDWEIAVAVAAVAEAAEAAVAVAEAAEAAV